MKNLNNDEQDFYYKIKILIMFSSMVCFGIGCYDKANYIILFLIFHNTLKR